MAKNTRRKTTTGTEGGMQGPTKSMDELEAEMGSDPVHTGAAPALESDEPTSETPEAESALESKGNAPAVAGAAPASVQKPEQPKKPEPRSSRNLRERAERLDGLPNEYVGEDAEWMKEEVIAMALASRTLCIRLNRWKVLAKKSYRMPRWYALQNKNIFVIQGD